MTSQGDFSELNTDSGIGGEAAAITGLSRLTLAATFTAEPLGDPLRFWFATLGFAWDVEFAPYNQVFQELLSPGSLLARNRSGYPVVLVRVEDFVRTTAHDDAPSSSRKLANDLERASTMFMSAVREFCRVRTRPLLLLLLPPSPHLSAVESTHFAHYTRLLKDELSVVPHVLVLSDDALSGYGVSRTHDEEQDRLAHVPYTPEMFAALATALARKLHMLEVPARKLLVLDCDNTLWGGVVGEDGPAGLVLGEAHLAMQQFAAQQAAQGVLVALCSKNQESDVEAAFTERTDFVLDPLNIVARRVNWNRKSQNILSLTRELNIGVDSVVFIDDNPVECAEVRGALPAVLTLQFPETAEAAKRLLSHLWVFDRVTVTDEDRQRAELYRQNAKRTRFKQQALSLDDFLSALELVTDIDALSQENVARASQLTQRTNQFNTTTLRRGEAEIESLAAQAVDGACVRVRDRFGDYGLVGFMTYATEADALVVDSLMLSCRVLARGVEHAMVRWLAEVAKGRGLSFVAVLATETRKNEPVLTFLEAVAADYRTDEAATRTYRIPVAVAQALAYSPDQESNADEADLLESPVSARTMSLGLSALYERVAMELTTGQAVNAATERSRRRTRAAELGEPDEAHTAVEKTLLTIWERVLGVEGLGVSDDFAAAGGTSLLAARVFAEIQRELGIKLPLSTLLAAPTIRKLALRVQSQDRAREGSIVPLRQTSGNGRNFFFIHDGFGETLLYVNLARRLPSDVAVYGLEPKRAAGIPLAHTSIHAMARHYVAAIRSRQPSGPYYVGGLCAGGTISVEVAHQLTAAGEQVALVALFDAAAPRATRRRGVVSSRRLERFSSTFSELKNQRVSPGLLARVIKRAGKKVVGAVRWELKSRADARRDRMLYRLLELALEREVAWPAWLPAWQTPRLYDLAEAKYSPSQTIPAQQVLLFRATTGTGNDKPHRETFERDDFGWSDWLPSFETIDVAGGHSSMLQEPYVEDVAAHLVAYIEAAESRVATSG